MFPECAPLNAAHSPPSSQAQLILTINIWKCFWIPIYGQQNGLKSVMLISKHLTLEWWLLAGEYAACQGCIWRKWLSSYPTRTVCVACVPRARSHYTRLLWSFSNFPKLRWPLLSGKLDWLEWFSLEKLCCWRSHRKAEAYEGLHTNPQQHGGHANIFESLHKGSDLWHSSSLIFSPIWFSDITLYCTALNRITVASKVLDLLNRCSFLQSAAVKCGHVGDFDAFSMFDSLRDLRSLSGLNPGPPSPCLPLSKIQNLGCENHLDVRGNPSLDWQENGLE